MTSERTAIDENRLAVDPAAVFAGQHGCGIGDVVRLSQPTKRALLGDGVDQGLRLVLQEELGRGGARRNGVDGDVSLAMIAVITSTAALVAA